MKGLRSPRKMQSKIAVHHLAFPRTYPPFGPRRLVHLTVVTDWTKALGTFHALSLSLLNARHLWNLRISSPDESYHKNDNRNLRRNRRRFWAADVNRKFMFLLLARFHARLMSYKALILAFTTWIFEWKRWNTHQRGEVSTSGWRP